MGLLQPLATDHGYLKAGFFGLEKSGKTFTSTALACHVYKRFGCTGPIAFFDTEGGSTYRAQAIQEVAPLVGVRGRSLDDLIAVVKECQDNKIQVLIVDSITDCLQEARESYEKRLGRKLEMRDYGVADKRMRQFCDLYLNSPIHIIACGKQSGVYEKSNGKMENVGNKLNGGPFAYLARLLVEMEKVKTGSGGYQHRANVAGDCFDVIKAGATFTNPKPQDFDPFLACLKPGAHAAVDLSRASDFSGEDDPEDRKALVDEIKEQCLQRWPTPTKSKGKPEALQACFGTDSSVKIAKELSNEDLREGLEKLRALPLSPA